MTSKAHFYHPKDNSLEEKVRAYQEAFQAWLNIEASFKFYDEQEWQDRLGSKEDLLKAEEITSNTLDKAVAELSKLEIQFAIERNLISNHEIEYLFAERSDIDKSMFDREDIVEAWKREVRESRERNSREHPKEKGLDFDGF